MNQGGRGHWVVNYTGTQSFTMTILNRWLNTLGILLILIGWSKPAVFELLTNIFYLHKGFGILLVS